MAASSGTQIPGFAAFERCEMLRGSKVSVRTRVTCIHSRAGWARGHPSPPTTSVLGRVCMHLMQNQGDTRRGNVEGSGLRFSCEINGFFGAVSRGSYGGRPHIAIQHLGSSEHSQQVCSI